MVTRRFTPLREIEPTGRWLSSRRWPRVSSTASLSQTDPGTGRRAASTSLPSTVRGALDLRLPCEPRFSPNVGKLIPKGFQLCASLGILLDEYIAVERRIAAERDQRESPRGVARAPLLCQLGTANLDRKIGVCALLASRSAPCRRSHRHTTSSNGCFLSAVGVGVQILTQCRELGLGPIPTKAVGSAARCFRTTHHIADTVHPYS